MKHPLFKWAGMVSWLVTALISINFGLHAFGYDFFMTNFAMTNLSSFMMVINYVVLASGLLSLLMLVTTCSGHCGCDSKGCCK